MTRAGPSWIKGFSRIAVSNEVTEANRMFGGLNPRHFCSLTRISTPQVFWHGKSSLFINSAYKYKELHNGGVILHTFCQDSCPFTRHSHKDVVLLPLPSCFCLPFSLNLYCILTGTIILKGLGHGILSQLGQLDASYHPRQLQYNGNCFSSGWRAIKCITCCHHTRETAQSPWSVVVLVRQCFGDHHLSHSWW